MCSRRLALSVLLVFMVNLCVGSAGAQPRVSDSFANAEYALTREAILNSTDYFKATRLDETIDSEGRLTSRSKSAGVFSRQVLFVTESGTRTDRYTWKSFQYGRTDSDRDSVLLKNLAAVQGFTYDLSSSYGLSLPPVPIGGMAKTPETLAFFMNVWDVAILVKASDDRPDYPLHRLTRIGDRITETIASAPAMFDFTPIVSDFSYRRSLLNAEFAGVSVVNGKPSAMVRFETSGNPTSYVYSTDRMTIRVKGTEWISGTVWLSLHDPNLVHGTLTNTFVATQTATLPGKTILAPVVVRQTLHVEQVSEIVFR